MSEPFSILAYTLGKPLLVRFTYNYKENLHYKWVILQHEVTESILILEVWRIFVKFAKL